MNKKTQIFALILEIFYSSILIAQTHKGISFQGVIKLPSGENPTRSGVTVNARILAPNDCILREEQFSGVNISNGYINLAVGTGTTGGYDPALSFKQVMDNSATINSLTCLNTDGTINNTLTSFNPTLTNGARKFRLSLTIDSIPIVADFNMRSMPFAINAEALEGKASSDFVNTNIAKNITQSNVESIFNRFTKLDTILNSFDGTATNLGANITGNAATANTALTANNVTGVVAIVNGGTGAVNIATARTNLGLGPLSTMVPTGTADNTTYLRGDGTWSTVSLGASETDPTVQTFAKNAPSTGLTVNGSNQLSVNVGTVAGSIAAGNDSRITGAFPTATNLSGDLSGILPSPVVEKIKGQTISATATDAGQVLRFTGTSWNPTFLSMFDLRSTLTGAQAFGGVGCLANQTLTWTSATDNLSCTNISINGTQVSGNIAGNAGNVSGTIAIGNGGTGATTQADAANAILPAQATHGGQFLTTNGSAVSWASIPGDDLGNHTAIQAMQMSGFSINGSSVASGNLTLDSTSNGSKGNVLINPTGGNIGVGTTSPQATLDLRGSMNILNGMITINSSNISYAMLTNNSLEGGAIIDGTDSMSIDKLLALGIDPNGWIKLAQYNSGWGNYHGINYSNGRYWNFGSWFDNANPSEGSGDASFTVDGVDYKLMFRHGPVNDLINWGGGAFDLYGGYSTSFQVQTNPNANSAGKDFELEAGGSSAGTNLNGGDLVFKSGSSSVELTPQYRPTQPAV